MSNATVKHTLWLSRKLLKERNNSEVPPLSFTQETNREIRNVMSVFDQKPAVPNKLFGLDTSEYYSQDENLTQFSNHSQNLASQNQHGLSPIHQRAGSQIEKSTEGFRDRINNTSAYFSQTLANEELNLSQEDMSQFFATEFSPVQQSQRPKKNTLNNTSAYFSQTLANTNNDELNLSQNEDMSQFFAAEFSPKEPSQKSATFSQNFSQNEQTSRYSRFPPIPSFGSHLPKVIRSKNSINDTSAYFSQNLTNDTTTSTLHIDTTLDNQTLDLSQNPLLPNFGNQEPNLSQNNQSGAIFGQNSNSETMNFSQNQFLPIFGNQEPNMSQNNQRNAFLSQNVANTPTTSNNMTMSSSYAELREIYKNRPPSKVNISSSDLSQTRVYSSSQNTNTPSRSEKSAPQPPPKYKPTFGRKFSATPAIQSYKNPYKQNQTLNNQSQNITPSFGITPNFNVLTPK